MSAYGQEKTLCGEPQHVKNKITTGWFPDPSGSEQVRYFDGHGWTEHLAMAVADAHRIWWRRPTLALPTALIFAVIAMFVGPTLLGSNSVAASGSSRPPASSAPTVTTTAETSPRSTIPNAVLDVTIPATTTSLVPVTIASTSSTTVEISPATVTAARAQPQVFVPTVPPSAASTTSPQTTPATTVAQPASTVTEPALSTTIQTPASTPPTTSPVPTTINAVPIPTGVRPGQLCGPPQSIGHTASGQTVVCSVKDYEGRFFWSQPVS